MPADSFSHAERDQLLAALVEHRAALRAVTGERAEEERALGLREVA